MLIRSVGDAIRGRDLPQISPAATIIEAAAVLEHYEIGAVVVMAEGRVLGLLSERDVLRRVVGQGLAPATVTVASAMTPDPVTVCESDPLAEAIAKMESGQFRHLPVMDGRGTCLGLLSVRDIPAEYRIMYEHFRALTA
ncbi:CBS domain-containing protein [Paracoccus sp. IB05]|uniref:CBS domain-containing protein n=1 Tax=Paracoccus sp. IB05 TaxID=2779367 RepID=UPI0018E8CC8E|nr:CBS domain-containing protein [Paracoccus sp. IB05]MBJ2153385.1 CBS domain-containing protein [Paracoccus sp. IB05]